MMITSRRFETISIGAKTILFALIVCSTLTVVYVINDINESTHVIFTRLNEIVATNNASLAIGKPVRLYDEKRNFELRKGDVSKNSHGKEHIIGMAVNMPTSTNNASYTSASKQAKYGVKISGKNYLIVYNRVPKCGSRTLMSLIRHQKDEGHIKQMSGFRNMQNEILQRNASTEKTSVMMQDYIKQLANRMTLPAVIDGHFHYLPINRSRNPVYMNIIRDPLSRLVSNYYFVRFGDGQVSSEQMKEMSTRFRPEHFNMTFDECVLNELPECVSPVNFKQIAFFCGFHPNCSKPTHWALEQAKKHVEKDYLLVGLVEDFDITIRVLEKLAPDLFTGIVQRYREPTKENATAATKSRKGPPPSENIRAIMMKKLHLEYQFYNFIKEKFEYVRNQLGITR